LSLGLLTRGEPLFAVGGNNAAASLLLLVVASITFPRIVALPLNRNFTTRLGQVCATIVVGCILAPPLMMLRGVLILVGPVQIRGFVRARVLRFDSETVWKTLAWFGPPALLGALIYRFLVVTNQHFEWPHALLHIHAALLACGPLTALLCSMPASKWFGGQSYAAGPGT